LRRNTLLLRPQDTTRRNRYRATSSGDSRRCPPKVQVRPYSVSTPNIRRSTRPTYVPPAAGSRPGARQARCGPRPIGVPLCPVTDISARDVALTCAGLFDWQEHGRRRVSEPGPLECPGQVLPVIPAQSSATRNPECALFMQVCVAGAHRRLARREDPRPTRWHGGTNGPHWMATGRLIWHRTRSRASKPPLNRTSIVGSHQVWPVTHRLTRTLASSRETPMPSARLIDMANSGSAAPS